MTRSNPRSLVALLLLLLLLCAPAPGAGLTARPQPSPPPRPQSQQEQQRDRTVPAPSAAPASRPTNAPPQATPTPQASSQASPTPPPTPQPTPGPRTLEDLRSRIAELLASPALAPAHFAVKVASLETGAVLFEENAGKLMMPASNMKIYTVATALDRLGPDFRFATSVYSRERPDAKGRLKGDLVVYGRGDPSFAPRFAGEGDYFRGVEELAASVASAGVKRIEGDIVGDESYFTGPPLGASWEWDDLPWYYGAPISALTINDNAFDLFIRPGARVGARADITTGPDLQRGPYTHGVTLNCCSAPFFQFENKTTTAPAGTRRELSVDRPLGTNVVVVSGTIPLGDPGFAGSIAAIRPAHTFAAMLREALARRGVTVKGSVRALDARERGPYAADPTKMIEIARRESAPFREIAAHTMKPSQNLYTELILRTLGKQFPPPPPADPAQAEARRQRTSAQDGHAVVRQFLREAGVADVERLSLVDGSGLARQNLITAGATVQLLTHMSRHRHFQIWLDAQPVAGIDGTLRGRLRGTLAAGNVRAKTGTISNVSALSGYVTTAAGERLVFSIIVNHYTDAQGVPPRTNFLDGIAALLASFEGRSTAVTGDK